MSDLLYRLNARDEISSVNEEWQSFARTNDGGDLLAGPILGRVLWDFIGDLGTVQVYRQIHRRVRADGVPVRLRIRCDAPARRRLLEIEISAASQSALVYRVRTLGEQSRDPVSLLEPQQARGEAFVKVCSWCNKMAAPPRGWLEVEAAIAALSLFADGRVPQLTHGICEQCVGILNDALADDRVNADLGRI
jgi:hypothetical protein